MPSPLDYIIRPQIDPIARGLNLASGIQQYKARESEAQQQEQQRQILMDQQQRQQQALSELYDNPNPTANDFFRVASAMPKDKAELLTKQWESIGADRQKSMLSFGGKVMSAFKSGSPDVGINLLKERAEAERESGDEDRAKSFETFANLAEVNPDMAYKSIGMMVSAMPGGKDVVENIQTLGAGIETEKLLPGKLKKQAADLGLTKAQTNKAIIEARKLESEILKTNAEASKVAAEATKTKMEMDAVRPLKLSTGSEKILNEAVASSANSMNLARQYNALATDIERSIETAGATGKAEEIIKKVWGSEDSITRLRQEYRRLRNSAVLDNLPPGVASDKDIEIAMSAFPDDTANPELIASFMKGMAKIQKYDSEMNDVKADWINNIGNLGSPRKEVVVSGVTVKPGEKFTDFVKTYIQSPIEGSEPTPAPTQETGAAKFNLPEGAVMQNDGSILFPDGSVYRP